MLDATNAEQIGTIGSQTQMTVHARSRRAALIGAAALVAAPLVQAGVGPDQRYAVLSIIGDKITLVGNRTATGSHLDQNDRRVVPVQAPVLDNSTLLAVDDAIKRDRPKAVTMLLASRDPKLFALQDGSLDNPGDAAESVAAIKTLLQHSMATRLILVSPYRAEARFQLRDQLIGSGKIAGLGFYIDSVTRITLADTGESGTGYLASYAYFAVSLIDAATMTTIGRKLVTESRLIPTSASKGATVPWEALTNDQKVDMLQSLTRQGLDRVVPELLAVA